MRWEQETKVVVAIIQVRNDESLNQVVADRKKSHSGCLLKAMEEGYKR